MNPLSRIKQKPIQAGMIAPCGMDCALCIGHLRENNRCPGCNHREDAIKAGSCRHCTIKRCEAQGHSNRFCFDCTKYPCRRLRRLDQRYQTKYGMSMLENLEAIRAFGIRTFVAREKIRWACPDCGATLCVHRNECLRCGRPRPAPPR
jgi:hypothetical protein